VGWDWKSFGHIDQQISAEFVVESDEELFCGHELFVDQGEDLFLGEGGDGFIKQESDLL
jgi:archaeosine-15-forming tRNA-guanine transglycosylase